MGFQNHPRYDLDGWDLITSRMILTCKFVWSSIQWTAECEFLWDKSRVHGWTGRAAAGGAACRWWLSLGATCHFEELAVFSGVLFCALVFSLTHLPPHWPLALLDKLLCLVLSFTQNLKHFRGSFNLGYQYHRRGAPWRTEVLLCFFLPSSIKACCLEKHWAWFKERIPAKNR